MTTPITYIVPAALLYHAAPRLQKPEKLCFATGIKMFDNKVVVLTELVDVEYTASSRFHVRPNAASVLRAHQGLLAVGQDIEMLLRSHPGTDQQATLPSPTDLHTASRWEAGAPFLGAFEDVFEFLDEGDWRTVAMGRLRRHAAGQNAGNAFGHERSIRAKGGQNEIDRFERCQPFGA